MHDIGHEGPADAYVVNPLVGPESGVLDCDDRVSRALGDPLKGDVGALFLLELADERIVVGVDLGAVARAVLLEVRNRGDAFGKGEVTTGNETDHQDGEDREDFEAHLQIIMRPWYNLQRGGAMEETVFEYSSPVGPLECVFLGEALVAVSIGQGREDGAPRSGGLRRPEGLSVAARRLRRQLDAYFRGTSGSFDLPVRFVEGTDFEHVVWLALKEIPRGKVISYQGLAAAIGKPRAARAVGQALGKNPLPIILPCHRVVRSDGSLGGFSCGLDIKRQLLELEGVRHANLSSSARASLRRRRA